MIKISITASQINKGNRPSENNQACLFLIWCQFILSVTTEDTFGFNIKQIPAVSSPTQK